MRAITLTITETVSVLKRLKEWYMECDKILFFEVSLVLLLIFAKVYVNSRFIYEKNLSSIYKKKAIETESVAKTMKIQLEKFRNKEKLDELSKTLEMEENIDVIAVKQ